MKLLAQTIGIVAMTFNIFSYQQKKQVGVLFFQLIGSVLFTVHFFMMKAYTGGLMNAIGIVRAVVFLKRDLFKSERVAWFVGFEIVYATCYVLTFTAFKTPFTLGNALFELLPVFGMTLTTVAFRSRSARTTRALGLINSPAWLIYNVFVKSYGAICCEAVSLISIIIGFFRLDQKSEETKEDKRA